MSNEPGFGQMRFHNNSYLNWKQYNTNSNTVLDEVFVYKQTDIDDVFAYDDVLVGVSIGILIIFVGIITFFAKCTGKGDQKDELLTAVEVEELVEKQEEEIELT